MNYKKHFKKAIAVITVLILALQLFSFNSYTTYADDTIATYDASAAEWQALIKSKLDSTTQSNNTIIEINFQSLGITVSESQTSEINNYIKNLALKDRNYYWINTLNSYIPTNDSKILSVGIYLKSDYLDKSTNNILKEKAASDYDILQQRINNGEKYTIIKERIEAGFRKYRNTTHSRYETYITIDLSDLFIEKDAEMDITNMISTTPEYAAFLDNSYGSYAASYDGNYIKSYNINLSSDTLNSDGQIDYATIYNKYFAYRKRIASLTGQLNKMTDLEKVLATHEWIVRECDYDYANYHNNKIPQISYYPEGVLNNGLAVCNGYMLTMTKLLTENGIACYNVVSGKMNHGWNIVKMDGNYYHIDSTWDDWGKDDYELGVGCTRYFLRSDEEITTLKHHDWNTIKTCDKSGAYEGYIFRNAKLGDAVYDDEIRCFSYYNNYWYYIKEEDSGFVSDGNGNFHFVYNYSIIRSKIDGSEETVLFKASDFNNEEFINQFIYGNYMYLATNYNVYRIDMRDTSKKVKIYSVKSDGSEGQINRMAIKNDKLIAISSYTDENRNTTDTKKEIDISLHSTLNLTNNNYNLEVGNKQNIAYTYNSEYGNNVIFLSDNPDAVKVDSNGVITAVSAGSATIYAQVDDVVTTCKVTVKAAFSYGDANGDGNIDAKDAVLIKKYLANYSSLSINTEACDVNHDGKISSTDAVKLLKYLAGYNVNLDAA